MPLLVCTRAAATATKRRACCIVCSQGERKRRKELACGVGRSLWCTAKCSTTCSTVGRCMSWTGVAGGAFCSVDVLCAAMIYSPCWMLRVATRATNCSFLEGTYIERAFCVLLVPVLAKAANARLCVGVVPSNITPDAFLSVILPHHTAKQNVPFKNEQLVAGREG